MPELKTFWRSHRQTGLEIFFALVLIVQFAGFVSVFSQAIDPRSLLSARDADGAHVVGTAARTRWYMDNGETAYGAFFYRFAHTFAEISGRRFATPGSAVENSERAHCLALMTISLLALFTMSWLLSGIALLPRWQRLLATSLLTALFLTDTVWARFVWRAHPDMLFGAVILAAFLATVHWQEAPVERKVWSHISAILWGLSGMVKLTFLVFLPPLLLLWLPPFSRAKLKEAGRYYLWMLPGYVLLTLPQSLNFPRPIKFLIKQGMYSLPPTRESMTQWLEQFGRQAALPLGAICVLALVCPRETRRAPLWRLLGAATFPFLVLLRQNTAYEMDYYLIPIVAVFIAWCAYAVRGRLPAAASLQPTVLATLAAITWKVFGFVPVTMETDLTAALKCRDEASAVYRRIHEEADSGRRLVIDPYVPYDRGRGGDRVHSGWDNDWKTVEQNAATMLVLSASQSGRYSLPGEPSQAAKVHAENWQNMQIYYRAFAGKSETTGPDGKKWRKVAQYACGYEVWIKDP